MSRPDTLVFDKTLTDDKAKRLIFRNAFTAQEQIVHQDVLFNLFPAHPFPVHKGPVFRGNKSLAEDVVGGVCEYFKLGRERTEPDTLSNDVSRSAFQVNIAEPHCRRNIG